MRNTDSSRSTDPEHSKLRLTAPSSGFDTRDAIEGYLDRLNRSSPLAQRGVTHWDGRDEPRLRLGAVTLPSGSAATDTVFLAEARTNFGLDVRAQRAAAAGAPYSVGLVLAGSMRVTTVGGEFVAQAGEGIIIDPSQVERTQFGLNSHFVEFMLPRTQLLRLGAELSPGSLAGQLQFDPVLPHPIAQRLFVMAMQTAEVLRDDGSVPATRVMFERWMELIGLTLLHGHRPVGGPSAADGRRSPVGGASPRSLSRALDYIDAHAQSDILLADIAAAACISVSALLRQFNEHMGLSPGAFLRQLRLDRARAELAQGMTGSISELARRWGFQSAGKFSQAYLKRFGERPSETRST